MSARGVRGLFGGKCEREGAGERVSRLAVFVLDAVPTRPALLPPSSSSCASHTHNTQHHLHKHLSESKSYPAVNRGKERSKPEGN